MAAGNEARDRSGIIRSAARDGERDRYLAALLAPREFQEPALAVAACVAEIFKIPRVVKEPHLAEIRLQWWRDALCQPQGPSGNPIADRFCEAFRGYASPRGQLENLFDTLAQTYYSASPQDAAALIRELEVCEGTPFALAARVCGVPEDANLEGLFRAAGVAYGMARLGLNMAQHVSRGRMPLPPQIWAAQSGASDAANTARAKVFIAETARTALAEVKSGLVHSSQAVKCVLLPLALVEPYLRAFESRTYDPLRTIGDIAPMTRVWRIWRAHATGRI